MPSKYQPILDVKTKNPNLSWTDAAREAGFKEGNFTSNGRGGVKPKTGDRAGQAQRRGRKERVYTTDAEFDNAKQIKEQARLLTQSTLSQYVYGPNNPYNGEHGRALSAGGTNGDLNTVSDPSFKNQKDTIEGKIYSTYGNPETGGKYVVDIDDVTGYSRAIKTKNYNGYSPTSQQPGYDIGPDAVLERVSVGGIPRIQIVDGKNTVVMPFMTKASNPPLGGFQTDERLPTTSAPTQPVQPSALGGFDMSRMPVPTSTANKLPAFTPPSVYSSNGEDENGHSHSKNGGNGNGNGNYLDSITQYAYQQREMGITPLPLKVFAESTKFGMKAAKVGASLFTGLSGGLGAMN